MEKIKDIINSVYGVGNVERLDFSWSDTSRILSWEVKYVSEQSIARADRTIKADSLHAEHRGLSENSAA